MLCFSSSTCDEARRACVITQGSIYPDALCILHRNDPSVRSALLGYQTPYFFCAQTKATAKGAAESIECGSELGRTEENRSIKLRLHVVFSFCP